MPAKTEQQAKFMRFCAHTDHPPERCPSRSVAREFMHTAKGKKKSHVREMRGA